MDRIKGWALGATMLFTAIGCASQKTELQEQGYEALAAKQYDEATRLYSLAIDEDQEDSASYLGRGLAHDGADRTLQALSDYRRASELNPESRSPHLHLAELQLRRGELEAARREVALVLTNEEDNPVSWLDRFAALAIAGRIELAAGQHYAARDRLQEALDMSRREPELAALPLHRDVLYLAAHAEYELRRFDRCRQYLESYQAAAEKAGEPSSPEVSYLLALTSYLDGDFEASKRHLADVSPEGRARLAAELGDERFFLAAR